MHHRSTTSGTQTTNGAAEDWVAEAARRLWDDERSPVRAWLAARGVGDDLARRARVGVAAGDDGTVVVVPALDAGGVAVGAELVPLDQADGGGLVRRGRLPAVAFLDKPGDGGDGVVVCATLADALVVAGTDRAAVAALGCPAEAAGALMAAVPAGRLVLAGDAAGPELWRALARAGAGPRVWRLAHGGGTVAGWAARVGPGFAAELARALDAAVPAGWAPVASAAALVDGFLAAQADPAGALAVPTGVAALDRVLAGGGWRPGVALVGGLAGVGKSAFALAAGLTAARAGHPVLYLSVEQAPAELLVRLVCAEARRPIAEFWNRDPAYLADARRLTASLPLDRLWLVSDPYVVVDDEGTLGRLRRWAATVAAQAGAPPLVVVDYLQRMRPPEAERRADPHRQVSAAGLGLRQLARDLGCAVVAVSSVSRHSYDRAPSLDAFKGSGDLEYDADACLLLRLGARSDAEAAALARAGGVVPVELHVLKNRYGPLVTDDPLRLDFDRDHGAFAERGRRVPPPPGAPTPPPLLPLR